LTRVPITPARRVGKIAFHGRRGYATVVGDFAHADRVGNAPLCLVCWAKSLRGRVAHPTVPRYPGPVATGRSSRAPHSDQEPS
jgi:hypothetical protein